MDILKDEYCGASVCVLQRHLNQNVESLLQQSLRWYVVCAGLRGTREQSADERQQLFLVAKLSQKVAQL